MKITYAYIVCLALVLTLCLSCNHYYYAPNDNHLLALSEKNDVKLNSSTFVPSYPGYIRTLGNESDRRHYNVQAGYSPLPGIGLQASYFTLDERGRFDDNEDQEGGGHQLEMSIGYYHKKILDTEDPVEYILFDVYGGFGRGKVDNRYSDGQFAEFKFNKYYIQPALHLFTNAKGFQVSLGCKIGAIDYTSYYSTGQLDSDVFEDVAYLRSEGPFFFYEPGLRAQLGVDALKFGFTLTSHVDVDREVVSLTIPALYRLAITLDLNDLFRPAQKPAESQ